jgi:ABC-type nitrate/sulfonate/bicarbonate transport system permease component
VAPAPGPPVIAALLAAWQVAVMALGVKEFVLPSP